MTTVAEKIASIAVSGLTNKDYEPVTMAGVKNLSHLVIDLIRLEDQNIDYALYCVRRHIHTIAKLSLAEPDMSLLSTHRRILESYYSALNATSFTALFMELVAVVVAAEEDDTSANDILRNIVRWADGCAHLEKEILLAAIRVGSQFTFDMIHWIGDMAQGLLAVSKSRVCDSHTESRLQMHASAMMSILTWVPDDRESVRLAENNKLTDVIFEVGMYARQRGCERMSREIANILLLWAFRAGTLGVASPTFEEATCGYVLLIVHGEDFDHERDLADISRRIRDDDKLDDDLLRSTATRLRARVRRTASTNYLLSPIDRAMSMVDREDPVLDVLDEVAELLTAKAS